MFKVSPPQTKEDYMYREIFSDLFPSPAAVSTVPFGKSIACSTAKGKLLQYINQTDLNLFISDWMGCSLRELCWSLWTRHFWCSRWCVLDHLWIILLPWIIFQLHAQYLDKLDKIYQEPCLCTMLYVLSFRFFVGVNQGNIYSWRTKVEYCFTLSKVEYLILLVRKAYFVVDYGYWLP